MKSVIITGTSTGLGNTLAKFFIEQGWFVYGISRSRATIDGNYEHYCVDIRDKQDVIAAMNDIRYVNDGPVDLLINNSAVFDMASFSESNIDKIDELIDTNVKGTMFVTHSALTTLKDDSKIVFVNSVAGVTEIETQAVYCASKHAITAFAAVLGKELRTRGIKVSSIHPGGINTTLWNEKNPYPGSDVSKTLDPTALSEVIHFIANCKHDIDFKTLTLFPGIEWH
jgi:NADP-dependent 3-hydroxy acid dehydrogenase YdfG